jgi:hypothetical protein
MKFRVEFSDRGLVEDFEPDQVECGDRGQWVPVIPGYRLIETITGEFIAIKDPA